MRVGRWLGSVAAGCGSSMIAVLHGAERMLTACRIVGMHVQLCVQ
jgi:hypothetical protein